MVKGHSAPKVDQKSSQQKTNATIIIYLIHTNNWNWRRHTEQWEQKTRLRKPCAALSSMYIIWVFLCFQPDIVFVWSMCASMLRAVGTLFRSIHDLLGRWLVHSFVRSFIHALHSIDSASVRFRWRQKQRSKDAMVIYDVCLPLIWGVRTWRVGSWRGTSWQPHHCVAA